MTATAYTVRRRVGVLAAALGALLIVACLAGSFWPRVGGTPVAGHWSGETLYLRADGPEAERCTISPANGPERTVAVPGHLVTSVGSQRVRDRLEPLEQSLSVRRDGTCQDLARQVRCLRLPTANTAT